MVMKVLAFFSHNISGKFFLCFKVRQTETVVIPVPHFPGDVYAWLVVFVLPLNAAVNPLLYTFTTPKYRAQLLPWGWTRLTGRSNNLNGSGGGASNQSNQGTYIGRFNRNIIITQFLAAESGKVMPLLSNTSNNTSKWKL